MHSSQGLYCQKNSEEVLNFSKRKQRIHPIKEVQNVRFPIVFTTVREGSPFQCAFLIVFL